MTPSRFFRRVLPVVALVLLGLAGTASGGDECEPFSASGTSVFVSGDGRDFELAVEGTASAGGAFSGSIVGRHNKRVTVQFAVITLEFANGDTLTLDTKIKLDEETGLSVGTYVIRDGTGDFAGASGSGDLVADTGAGTFEMDGTICE